MLSGRIFEVRFYLNIFKWTQPFIVRTSTSKSSISTAENQMKMMIAKRKFHEVIDLFDSYTQKHFQVTSSILVTHVLKAYTQLGDRQRGLQLHKTISSSLKQDPYVLSSLIHFYMNFHDIKNAEILFQSATSKTLSMYGAMMTGYIKNRLSQKAIDLFHQIKTPDDVIYIILFNACSELKTSEASRLSLTVYSSLKRSCLTNQRLIASLLDALMKCKDVKSAETIFNKLKEPNNYILGAMMKGYLDNNLPMKTIEIFHRVEKPDHVIILLLFNACARIGNEESLKLIKNVSSSMDSSLESKLNVMTSLIDAFMKCGDIHSAEIWFKRASNKNVSVHGAMMKGYLENNMLLKTIEIYHQIKRPDGFSLSILFNTCAKLRNEEALTLVKTVSSSLNNSMRSNPFVMTSLIDALMKCGDVNSAETYLDQLSNPTTPVYGAMMKGYLDNNLPMKTIEIFHRVEKPDHVVVLLLFNACAKIGNEESLKLVKKVSRSMSHSIQIHPNVITSLIDAFMKHGDVENAELVFNSKGLKILPAYAVMMRGYAKNRMPQDTIHLMTQLKLNGLLKEKNIDDRSESRVQDKENTKISIYLALVNALARLSNVSMCESFIQDIPSLYLNESRMKIALIDTWGKCGRIDKAKEIFDRIHERNAIVLTSMINCYGLNGMCNEAIELYNQIPNESRDELSHVSVLNACSHSGFIEKANDIFQAISLKTEKIYTTMIDCLSRASLFEQAKQLLDDFEKVHLPYQPMYLAILSGVRNQNNHELGQEMFDRMNDKFPQADKSWGSASVLLANTYASAGDIDTSTDIKIRLGKSGIKKQVGISWTVVNGQFFAFRAHDQLHSKAAEIHGEVERIAQQLIEHGFEYDQSWITRSLNENETTGSVLDGHSERLAIAWNFLENPQTKFIQVTKNLRVCGDCHRAIKLIAKIRQCDIIIRDANRVHHFQQNGHCSCNDYF